MSGTKSTGKETRKFGSNRPTQRALDAGDCRFAACGTYGKHFAQRGFEFSKEAHGMLATLIICVQMIAEVTLHVDNLTTVDFEYSFV